MAFVPWLNQIAFSVVDLALTERWFREGFGFLPAGGSRLMARGPLPSRIQGLPRVASTLWWLVGRNRSSQLELFQFERPLARLMPADFRPCDIGYTRIGLWVQDFDATLVRMIALGTPSLTGPIGTQGRRRACVRNPDGVFVEIMEDDPLAGRLPAGRDDCPVAIRSVTMSVPDLEQTTQFLSAGVGIAEAGFALHEPAHETLWNLPGAQTRCRVFAAGDVLLEVVQYLDPVGKSRPNEYRICDQGILNIAFGAHHKRDQMEVYRRTIHAGARQNSRPVHIPGAGCVYVNDPQNFSVEIMWTKPGSGDRAWGFEPKPIERRPKTDTHRVERSVHIAAPIEAVWAVVADHEGMAAWSGFNAVTQIVRGAHDPAGYGTERRMSGAAGTVVEQIVAWDPPRGYRYRVTEGSPLVCHQGEVRLVPVGNATELSWTVRFRAKLPGTGGAFRALINHMVREMLHKRLKPLVELR